MFEKFLLKDTSGNKSTTLTVFVIGFITVNIKLLISGLTIGDYTMSTFTGVDYAAALSALGGIYVMRRSASNNKVSESQEGGE